MGIKISYADDLRIYHAACDFAKSIRIEDNKALAKTSYYQGRVDELTYNGKQSAVLIIHVRSDNNRFVAAASTVMAANTPDAARDFLKTKVNNHQNLIIVSGEYTFTAKDWCIMYDANTGNVQNQKT